MPDYRGSLLLSKPLYCPPSARTGGVVGHNIDRRISTNLGCHSFRVTKYVDPLVSVSNYYVGLRHGEFAALFPGHKEEGKPFSPSICLG